MKLLNLLTIIFFFNLSLQRNQQTISTIEEISSMQNPSSTDIEATTSTTNMTTAQTNNPVLKLNAITEIKNQCLTIPQFEGLYPEYAQKTLIQRFNTEKIIGKGTFGKVISAKLNKKEIVIKKVNLPNETYSFLVSKELEFLKKIKGQPHLLQLYLCVYDEQSSTVYILTEKLYNDLENLESEFKKKKKSERLQIYLEIAKSLKELHSLKIIHQDLKPANIMVTNKNIDYPKLIDFGLSTYKGEKNKGGSPLFNANEKLSGRNTGANEKLDVVSLGVTICVLEIGFKKVKASAARINLYEKESLRKFHDNIGKGVDAFSQDLKDKGFFGKVLLWFKGIFVDVKKEKVLNFRDFLARMMDNDVERRFGVDEVVFVLERFVKFYKELERVKYLNVV